MNDKLKIGVIASNVLRLPPTVGYVPPGWSGAPEWNAYEITEGLVERGHEVTLFASGDSKTSAKLESVNPVNSYQDPEIGLKNHVQYEFKLLSHAYQVAEERGFDIIHSHIPARSTFFAGLVDVPTVTTLHSSLDSGVDGTLRKDSQYHVSISNAQRAPALDLNYISTIYHGINPENFCFSDNPGDHLIYAGRMVPEKGVHLAVKAARMANERLLLLGSVPNSSRSYWKEKIEPHIDGKNITHKESVDRMEVPTYLSKSKAFLFPVQLSEPFGFAMIESMATGTPVIAFDMGSASEIIEHGKTGYIVKPNGLESMVDSIKRVPGLNRREVRKRIETNFTLDREIDSYVEVYGRILDLAKN